MQNRNRQTAPPTMTLRGRIDLLFFSSPEFSAGVLAGDDGISSRFAGKVMVQVDEEVELEGRWEDTKFGPQLQVTSFRYAMPLDRTGLANYLARNPQMKNVGRARARAIAEQFGDDFDRALQDRPADIARVAKVPVAVIQALADEWFRTRIFNLANTWLAAFDLTHHQVTTLVTKYGNNVVAIFKADPYRLIGEIEGYGFKRVDQIARKMGTAKDHHSRIRGGILHCVSDALDGGHCWTEYEDLVDQANALLVMDTLDSRERISTALDSIIDDRLLACEGIGGRFLVARPDLRHMEKELAGHFRRANERNQHFAGVADIPGLVSRQAPELNAGQTAAVVTALSSRIVVITGGAGSGKTYTVNYICRLYAERELSVMLCAPTGKAAKRLEESTGRSASTIHRLLGYNGKEFLFEGHLDADLLVVDEVSMVDVPLFWHLLRAVDLDRTAVVLVGDHNQLPPVGPGNVLRDLIATRAVPVALLRDVVRQAGVLKENCSSLLSGRVAPTAAAGDDGLRPWYRLGEFTDPAELREFVLALYQHKLCDELGLNLIHDVQLLTPTRKGPLGVPALNIELQRLLQQKLFGVEVPPVPPGRRPPLLPGDKIIMRKNTYSLDLMNGSVGQVVSVAPKTGDVTATFDGRRVVLERKLKHLDNLDLAYCLTVHQTQGSEFPVTIFIVSKQHWFQLNRSLLYTGATRAQRSTIIVGDHWAIRSAAARVEAHRRRTWLGLNGAAATKKRVTLPASDLRLDA